MAWFKRPREAFESFKRYAQDTKELPSHRKLSSEAVGERLVYEVNPVYLEAGQGGTSPMRGWGALLFIIPLFAVWRFGLEAIFVFVPKWWGDSQVGYASNIFIILAILIAIILMSLVSFAYLVPAFFSATDVITRYDRKRNKVWMWTGRGPIEMDWNALTPMVRSGAASAYMPTRLYRGLYVEYGADGAPRKTNGIAHVVQVGTMSATEEGVLPGMEYVRSYMEQGPQSLPPVQRFLRHRPKWWAMFNFADMIQGWIDYREGKGTGLKPSYGIMVFFVIFFPIMFPLQFTNWLALKVAPRPKWPKDLLRMHEQDLAEQTAQVSALPGASRLSRKPVIRVNGKIVDVTPDEA